MARFPPPEVLASWPEPNFVDPINRGPALMIVELTILPIALVCLALRLYVRLCIIRKSWWDDWLMVGGAVFASGVTVCVILATQFYGWNLHVWDLTPQQMQQGRQISIAAQTIFLFASGLTKLSMLASYLRIAPLGSAFRKLTWATIYVVFALIWIFIIVLWTQCIPVAHYWHLSPSSADSCIGEWPPLAAQAITTVVTDLIVTVLPMPTLWKLRLPVYQRIGLMVLFGFGVIVVVAGAMRTYWTIYVTVHFFDVPGTSLLCLCGLPLVYSCIPAVCATHGRVERHRWTKHETRPCGAADDRHGRHEAEEGPAGATVAEEPWEEHGLETMSSRGGANTPVKEPPPGWLPINDTWNRGPYGVHDRV
ncbi:conserved hypothetical protein [Verticillium alfalfae VaMs.102]|uniref:Rhodopsin domain-containing protein n=1 Tax=Verticillium alfalfae (strain VaMs.102 / ATCC MYA-4576 / FGSC 10136) TaxID=526221 RepID=C9SRV2_VERA1|nr:conserved hypothetical protein [Verticillium alfalfae VaMs.102]EEY21517.1 conserved hypothetical protein [Verticillium alfalfae VaMs.102]